jgi:hypothetical protein
MNKIISNLPLSLSIILFLSFCAVKDNLPPNSIRCFLDIIFVYALKVTVMTVTRYGLISIKGLQVFSVENLVIDTRFSGQRHLLIVWERCKCQNRHLLAVNPVCPGSSHNSAYVIELTSYKIRNWGPV